MKKHSKQGIRKPEYFRLVAILSLLLVFGAVLAACSSDDAGSSDAPAEASSKITEFATVDLDGGEVSQEIFSEADITMINFWGTYCPPCIAEMPELAKLEAEYDGRMQLIGVPVDVDFSKPDSDEFKSALEILETAGAKFRNIEPAGGISEYMKSMQYVPTSIFVDSDGNIIGEAVIGAQIDIYKSTIEGYLAEHE